MDSRLSVKVVSLFLIGSVCLLGYTAMSVWGHPFPVPGAITIDPDSTIYQSSIPGQVVQIFFSDSVETLDKLTVDHDYIQINDGTEIGVQSPVDCELNLTTWEPLPEKTAGIVAEFRVTSAGNWVPFQFYIGNLKPGLMYNVLIDGAHGPALLVASINGNIGFAYAGPPGEHDFKVRQSALTAQEVSLISIIAPLIAIGILIPILGFIIDLAKEKKKPKLADFINLVIFIVIGASLMTVIGAIIRTL